jgi:hypothetical protein
MPWRSWALSGTSTIHVLEVKPFSTLPRRRKSRLFNGYLTILAPSGRDSSIRQQTILHIYSFPLFPNHISADLFFRNAIPLGPLAPGPTGIPEKSNSADYRT